MRDAAQSFETERLNGATTSRTLSRMKRPASLIVGDRISVVAPSGPFEEDLLQRGLARLARYIVAEPDTLWGRREGFFAGSDESRLQELQIALDDPLTQAILVARGGYGLARLLPLLDFSAFEARPKWLMGFSDVTVLHAALAERGIASLHAANGTTLARASDAEVDELCALLEGATRQTFDGLEPMIGGQCEGPLFGGNLTVLFAEAASGRLRVPKGAILLLEDVNETSYRIDRMLTALLAGGHLSSLAGVLLGDFVDCSAGRFEVPVKDVLLDRLKGLRIPILDNFPTGHGKRNRPLLLGAHARITDGHCAIELAL